MGTEVNTALVFCIALCSALGGIRLIVITSPTVAVAIVDTIIGLALFFFGCLALMVYLRGVFNE